jgi:protein O-GlcNAcase/histone acetyltransferase
LFTSLGPKVISKVITEDSIDELAKVIQRPPVIWDNLHANDYDQRRLFLGPYVGRSVGLIPKLNGVLTNPNCEYGANYVPIHTLALWSQCGRSINHKSPPIKQSILLEVEREGRGESGLCLYEPQKALEMSLKEWFTEFQIPRKKPEHYKPVKSAESVSKANDFEGSTSKMDLDLPKVESTSSKMDTTLPPVVDDAMHLSNSLPSPYEAPPSSCNDPFSLDDVKLLVDYFYLPHKHGSRAMHILEEFCWLKEKAPGYELLKAHGYLRGHEVKDDDGDDVVARTMVTGGVGEGMSCSGMRSDGDTSESIVEDEEMSDGEVSFLMMFRNAKVPFWHHLRAFEHQLAPVGLV